jgi:hypothetical protein
MNEETLLFYVLAGFTVVGILLFIIAYLVNSILDAITWIREDPDHLPLPDDWDPNKSRGRIKKT